MHKLSDYFWQAHLTALVSEQKDRDNHLCFFDDLAPAQLYRYVAENGMSGCFVHPLVQKLQTYDTQNITDLYKTLRCYCKTMFNKNHTAEQLHIHRNTLTYRLKRIEEMFGVDLNDPRILHHLLISVELEEEQAAMSKNSI